MTDNKKRDRPKAINPRSKQYRIRLTDDECEALKTIAKKHNLSVSKLIRTQIIEGEYQMTINEYQKAAYRTANQSLTDSQQLQNGLMGLNGESGECIDILKKYLFQGHDLDKAHIAKELGDVAWYLDLRPGAYRHRGSFYFPGKRRHCLYVLLHNRGTLKKAMDIEIRRQLAEYDLKHANELDATILWHLHEEFGFGPKRLKQFYDTFAVRLNELIKHYEMTDSDMVWLCTYKLKQYGIDIEEWNKQRRD